MPAETPTELLAAMWRDISTQQAFDPAYRPRLANYADRIRDALDGAKVADEAATGAVSAEEGVEGGIVRVGETEAGDRVHLTLTEVEYDAVVAEVEREPRAVPVLAALLRRHRREVAPPIDPINIDALMRGEG